MAWNSPPGVDEGQMPDVPEFSKAELLNFAALEDELAKRIAARRGISTNEGMYWAECAAEFRAKALRDMAQELDA